MDAMDGSEVWGGVQPGNRIRFVRACEQRLLLRASERTCVRVKERAFSLPLGRGHGRCALACPPARPPCRVIYRTRDRKVRAETHI